MMDRTLIFNHIPKTGGTTFRIILNRVYGEERVFFINSKNPGESLDLFKNYSVEKQKSFNVIAGHGADFFSELILNPFRIAILRNPIDLFLSQYYYLKTSPNSIYQSEVSKLNSIDDYIDFAVANGQDNLMVRHLSNSINWLIDSSQPIPNMDKDGQELLFKAKNNLDQYQAILDLQNFDNGIFVVSELLNWKRIPIYRPTNKTENRNKSDISDHLMIKLAELLRFDFGLISHFQEDKLDISNSVKKNSNTYKFFKLKQNLINRIFS